MPRRVLVVDDQEAIQYFLRKTLEAELDNPATDEKSKAYG